MPFTVSHAVAALPFLRTPLPVAALVVGTMAPDLPYFLPLGIPRDFSHSLLGAVTVDLAVGVVVLVAWIFLLRAPLLDYAPSWLRDRMPARERATVLWTLLALVVGAFTHLAIDTVTHEGSLDAVLPVMALEIGPYSVANYVHFVISCAGAAILAIWVRRWVQRTPRREAPDRESPDRNTSVVGTTERTRLWITFAAGFLAVFFASWTYQLFWVGTTVFDQNALFVAFCYPVGIFGVIALVLCAVWHRRARARSTVNANNNEAA